MKYILLSLLLLTIIMPLAAQNTLSINGLNEATFVYRTVEDSLNAYFKDSFGFNLAYRNFSFGMKFIAELPKYSTEQSELMDELDPNRLDLGWQELYAEYSKDAFSIHAGTTEETFGNGLSFRSYKDIEFDEDHRIESFMFKYDDAIKLKAIYGAIENPSITGKYDLAYGADALVPVLYGLKIGASAVTYRNLTALNIYNQREVYSGRMALVTGNLDINGEYASSNLHYQHGEQSTEGSAIYTNGSYSVGPLSLGAAYKKYDKFQFRLQDLPLANHHSETLSDAQASGEDEEGYQAFATLALGSALTLNLDYAEAWSKDEILQMNDGFAALDYSQNGYLLGFSYSHIEKLNEDLDTWQQDLIPAMNLGVPVHNSTLQLMAEYKMVEKQKHSDTDKHLEPKLQADYSLGKLSMSLGAQSHWLEVSEMMNSRYWASLELKYPVASHSDLIIFAGKEAGGKVCRNGVCRYVAPFQGLKVELNTRF